eukprot:jgi/Ulvmu1/2383/UM130_0016.1
MSDAVVWEIINHGHCSYKAKTDRQNFCRNEYNVSGLCNRSSCPLANSRYATIREDKGRVYLCIKTIERAHTPNKLWQKIRLSRQYMKALGQIDEHLAHWPKFLVHKNKQRLTKITQYLIRMRKLALKPRTKIITEPSRLKKMERRKEAKAEKAANVTAAIEDELMTRLKSGTYGDIYNFPMAQYNRVLDSSSVPDEQERNAAGKAAAGGDEGGSEFEDEEEFESEDEEEIEYVEDLDESDGEDIEDIAAKLGRWPDSAGASGSGSESGSGSGSGGDTGSESEEEEGGPAAGRGAAKGGRAPKRRRRDGAAAAGGKKGRMEMEVEEELVPARRLHA